MIRLELALHPFFLSPVQQGDQAAYVEHFRDKETTDSLLLIPFPYTEKDAELWVASRLESARRQAPETHFALRREDGFLIGGVGLVPGTGAGAHRADIGYWTAKEYRRRGLATAATGEMVHYAFDHLGLKRLQAWVFPQNASSQHVLERNGFRREAFVEAYHSRNGEFKDAYLYGLVRGER